MGADASSLAVAADEMMRMMLYEAAHIMLVRSAKWSWLKAWAIFHTAKTRSGLSDQKRQPTAEMAFPTFVSNNN
jgi:hypothetical protein